MYYLQNMEKDKVICQGIKEKGMKLFLNSYQTDYFFEELKLVCKFDYHRPGTTGLSSKFVFVQRELTWHHFKQIDSGLIWIWYPLVVFFFFKLLVPFGSNWFHLVLQWHQTDNLREDVLQFWSNIQPVIFCHHVLVYTSTAYPQKSSSMWIQFLSKVNKEDVPSFPTWDLISM